MTKGAYMHAIRGELGELLEAISDAEEANAFERGSVEQLLTDLIKSSATRHYEYATAVIRKAKKQ